MCHLDRIAQDGESTRQRLGGIRIVFDDQHPARARLLGRNLEARLDSAIRQEWSRSLQRLGDDGLKLSRSWREIDPAERDARGLQQLVHAPRHVLDLPPDDVPLVLEHLAPAQLHQLQGREDGRERIAQLVSQHGDELIRPALGIERGRLRAPQHLLGLPMLDQFSELARQ
jgi:hypothetical protein